MKSKYCFTKKCNLLVFVMTLFIGLMLVGCSKNYTKSYTLNVETGDNVKITMDAEKGYSLDKTEDGFFCIKNKNDADAHCTLSFYVPDVYGQYSIQLILEDCETKTVNNLIKDKDIEVHTLTYEGDSVAMFWIPNAGTGIYLYYENDDNMSKLNDVMDMMTVELVKASNDGSVDPFDDIKRQMQGVNISSSSGNIRATQEVNYYTGNQYWEVPVGYEELYACEYFNNYTKEDIIVYTYYEADESDLKVLDTGKFDYYDFDEVNIWQADTLYFVEARSDIYYQYSCMTKDGSVYLKLEKDAGEQIEQSEVENIVCSFLKS